MKDRLDNAKNPVLKRYYDLLFPESLKENEYIRIVCLGTDEEENPYQISKYVQSYTEYEDIVYKYRKLGNLFNSLATVKNINGYMNGTAQYQRQRRVLFLDFDLKDYQEIEQPDAWYFSGVIKRKFPDVFLHAYYNSGHGFHFYIAVKPSCNWREIVRVNTVFAKIVGADTNSCKPTQLARIPCTYNRKYPNADGEYPYVKEIVNKYVRSPENGHKGFYCLSYLQRRTAEINASQEANLQYSNWNYAEGSDIRQFRCLCNEKAFRHGVDETERDTFQGRLIWWMLSKGFPESKIYAEVQSWNMRCRPPKQKNIVDRDTKFYLKHQNVYHLNGCYWKISDSRVKEIVEKYCDKIYCYDSAKFALNDQADGMAAKIRVNRKLLDKVQLINKGEKSLSGYEFLILNTMQRFQDVSQEAVPIAKLKQRLMYKEQDSWKFCMDSSTLKKTLNALIAHKCIILKNKLYRGCRKKSSVYDDQVIQMTQRLKKFENAGFIEVFDSAAKALISKKISQTDYKIFLTLVKQIETKKSCTLDVLSDITGLCKPNIRRALLKLQKANCIQIEKSLQKTERGVSFNIYRQIETNRWNDCTSYTFSNSDEI